jgi:hypothetical protein
MRVLEETNAKYEEQAKKLELERRPRGKELVVFESNLQPKLHDLMASSIKE